MNTNHPQKEQNKDSEQTLAPNFNFDLFTPEAATAHLSEIAKPSEPLPHKELLGELLNQLKPVDFSRLSDSSTITEQHYLVITIEQLLNLAKAQRWEMCSHNGKSYLFNGAFWNPIEPTQLEFFLGNAAERLGVNHFKAAHFNFKEKLVRQFESAAVLSHPEPSPELVLFNLKNGTFEVNADTGNKQLRPHNSADFLTYQLSFEYNPTAQAPQFQAYLDKVLPEQELQQVLAEYLGWVFVRHSSGKLKLERALVLYGSGANGKSVFFDITRALFGKDSFSSFNPESLTDKLGYNRAALEDKLVNYASEISGKLESDYFKQMVSGEPVSARALYQNPITLTNYAKFIFNCNELPKTVEQTDGFFRRWLIVPFRYTVPKAEQDVELAKKIIKSELAGVFNWALAGLDRLLAQRAFTFCDVCNEAEQQFKIDTDSVAQFLQEQGYIKSTTTNVGLQKFYSYYSTFCVESGFQRVNLNNFRKRLEGMGFDIRRRNGGNVCFAEQSQAIESNF